MILASILPQQAPCGAPPQNEVPGLLRDVASTSERAQPAGLRCRSAARTPPLSGAERPGIVVMIPRS